MEYIDEIIKALQTLTATVMNQEERINKLYSNNSVRKGWCPEINKDKIDYMLEIERTCGTTTQKRETEIIVSLTSFPERMYDIKYTLYSLLHQSLKPDRIILWLAKEQFPNLEEDIAPSILALRERGLSIMWCEDIKSYKKLVPALRMFPDAIIVTADDDIYYPENWLELLYNSYLRNPNCVSCHRAHKVQIMDDRLAPYGNWEKEVYIKQPTFYAFPTSGAGALYPPNILHNDVINEDYFMKLATYADDVWFWTMSVLNGTKIKIVDNGIRGLNWVNPARELGMYNEKTLSMDNTGAQGKNDIYINNVLEAYPDVLKILLCDENINLDDWEGSANYWEQRYVAGGTSGAGSYSRLAEFKEKVLNQFVEERHIQSVIEWGCGDGNQLKLAKYPQYLGYDVSNEAVRICQGIFSEDNTKEFVWSGAEDFVNDRKADLALSLDVLYHLVEDDVFELYMSRLFESSNRFVCIYSCNFDKEHAQHVKCRKFTDYIEKEYADWKLIKVIKNDFPYDEKDPNNTSWSDFYIYENTHK